MGQVAYRSILVDLGTQQDRRQIIDNGNQVEDVALLILPVGAIVDLHIGRGDAIPLRVQGMAFKICPPERDGLFVTHPAQPGVSVTLLIGFGVGLTA